MQKFRNTIFFVTIIIAFVIIAGIVTVIISPKTIADSAYDLVTLTISGISIAIAIYSEIELNMEVHRVDKLLKQMNEMHRNISDDMTIDKNVRYKLDKIIALDEEIYRKMGGRKKSKDILKDATKKEDKKEAKKEAKKETVKEEKDNKS